VARRVRFTTAAGFLFLFVASVASAEPATPSTDLAEAVRRLGSPSFPEREAAQKTLLEAGEAAIPFVEKALQDIDPEIRDRVQEILKRLRWYGVPMKDPEVQARLEETLWQQINSSTSPQLKTIPGTARYLSDTLGLPFIVSEKPKAAGDLGQERGFGFGGQISPKTLLDFLLTQEGLYAKVLCGGVFISPKPEPTRAELLSILLQRLEAPEEVDRLNAARMLRTLTGETRGYDPYAGPEGNRGSLKSWQEWWASARAGIEAASLEEEQKKFRSDLDEGIAFLKTLPSPPNQNLGNLPGALQNGLWGWNERIRKLTDMARTFCPELARPRLLALLEDKNPAARSYAISLAATLGLKEQEKPLLALLRSQDTVTVQLSALALAELDQNAAVEPLLGILKDGPDDARPGVAYALGRMGRRESLVFFQARLDSQAAGQMEQALSCLNSLVVTRASTHEVTAWKAWWEKNGAGLSWDPQGRRFRVPVPAK